MIKTKIFTGVVHKIPADVRTSLINAAKAKGAWNDLTSLARNEWICWVTSVKKPETRKFHIQRMITELEGGKAQAMLLAGLPSSQTKGEKMVLTTKRKKKKKKGAGH